MSKRILVVNSDVNLALGIQELLELEGYTVDVAYDPQSGLALAWEYQPNLIISMFFEGEFDYREMLGALCAAPHTEQLPVLFLTDWIQYRTIQQQLGHGVLQTLTIPITAGELLLEIQSLLRDHAL